MGRGDTYTYDELFGVDELVLENGTEDGAAKLTGRAGEGQHGASG